MKLIATLFIIVIQTHLYAENIDSLFHESCKLLYPTDTIVSFIEEYNGGKLDTVSLKKEHIQNLKIDLMENTFSLKTLPPGKPSTRPSSPTCYNDKTTGIERCIQPSDCLQSDTIKINFSEKKIISLSKNKFDHDELYRIKDHFKSLQNNLCEPKGFTSKYRIINITSDLSLKEPPECFKKNPCGQSKFVNGYCRSIILGSSFGRSVSYPKTDYDFSLYYIDPEGTTYSNKRNQWSIEIKNFYGFDTTLVFDSPPIHKE